MTNPTVIHRFQDNEAVAAAPDGETVEGVAGADTAEPHLAAILHSYEEAKANIVDPAPPWPSPADGGDPVPETEMIDLSRVALPVVPDGSRGTEAMSAAARVVAERSVLEDAGPPATDSDPGPEPGTATPGRRGWWRGIRKC